MYSWSSFCIRNGTQASPDSIQITGSFGSPARIGELFLSDYLLTFEVTSIILLVGAVGGVVLGSAARRRAAPPPSEPRPPEDAAPRREPVGVE